APNFHQSGSAPLLSMDNWLANPITALMPGGGSNEATIVPPMPALVLHAKVLLATPNVPQSFQERLMPSARAAADPPALKSMLRRIDRFHVEGALRKRRAAMGRPFLDRTRPA